MDRLSNYPYVEVRIRCSYCPRQGQYRLARLAQKFGAEIELEDLLDCLAIDCPYRPDRWTRLRTNKKGCGAYFPDLTGPPRPPDIAPMTLPLRVVAGGRK